MAPESWGSSRRPRYTDPGYTGVVPTDTNPFSVVLTGAKWRSAAGNYQSSVGVAPHPLAMHR